MDSVIEAIEKPALEVTLGEDQQTAHLPTYWIVMHNDPITTMDFVVRALIDIFGMDADSAFETMYRVHHEGLERIGAFPLEHAEAKVESVHFRARASGYPLTCTIEKV